MPVYKNEEKKTYYCKFYYKDWQGNLKQHFKRGFNKQSEAKTYERQFLDKVHANCNMTFKSLVELYLEDCKSRLKATTLDNKTYTINLKILPYFQNMPINEISPAIIRKWQNKLIADDKGYSETYLKTIHNQLSAILNYAVRYYNLRQNQAAVCGSMGKKNADAMQFWTREEFKKFIPAVEDKLTSKTIFELLFWTGMRSGELLALTLNDFDFENKTVSIDKNYARLNFEDLILPPKTPKSKRIITIPDFLCDIVNDYSQKLYDYDANDRLFNVTKFYLTHEMIRGCKKSGVKRIRIHDLRHSHASLLIELGFSPLLIAERLGHEKVETTLQIYSHLYPNKHSEVATKLEELNK